MKNSSPQPLIIKKYENRRLYNTLTSQYINQEQVAELVRDGHDVRVVDAATGDDITRLILAQIVLDDVKTPNSVFPLDVLRQMIVASGKATQDNALRYMKAMMEMYKNAYQVMPSPLNPFEFFPGGWSQSNVREDTSRQEVRLPSASRRPQSRVEAPSSEVTDLRRRLEELEAALDGRKPKGKSQKRKTTKSRRKS